MLFHGLNCYLFPVEYPGGQCGLHIGLFKNFTEVFNLSGTGGGNYWDGDVFTDMFHKFNVKATVRTVFIDAVE